MGQNIDRTKAKAEEVTDIARESALLAISNSQRMRVLGLLRVKGPMTVGMISDVTGMAPGSVSFHLKKLFDAGMAEKTDSADGDKRKSWWKANHRSMRPAPRDDGRIGDAEYAYFQSVAVTYESLYERYLDSVNDLPQEWREVGLCEDRTFDLTPEETEQMCLELDAVAQKWQQHSSEEQRNTARRNMRKVQIVMQAFPWIP